MNGILFSFAAAPDIDDVLAIEIQSFQSPWPRVHFENELAKPYSHILLARLSELTGRICGFIIYWLIIDELHILDLAVSPPFRRQGIAAGLLRETIRHAQTEKVKIAWLEVRSSNKKALSLYFSMGFKQVMTRRRYYTDTGEDALILSRSLL